jgi:hypothetical protein
VRAAAENKAALSFGLLGGPDRDVHLHSRRSTTAIWGGCCSCNREQPASGDEAAAAAAATTTLLLAAELEEKTDKNNSRWHVPPWQYLDDGPSWKSRLSAVSVHQSQSVQAEVGKCCRVVCPSRWA